MKKLILVLAILTLSISAFTQSVEKVYKFWDTSFDYIFDGDTVSINVKYYCNGERKMLEDDNIGGRIVFDYYVEQYIGDEFMQDVLFDLGGSLRFKEGMTYTDAEDIVYDFDGIIEKYHSGDWQEFRKRFLRLGAKGKWGKE